MALGRASCKDARVVWWSNRGALARGLRCLALGWAAFACSEASPPARPYPDTDGSSCTPGATRCQGELAFQSCTPAGTWGGSVSCAGYSDNGTSSYCAQVTSGEQRWAACVDPACWWWLTQGLAVAGARSGVCTGEHALAACAASGVLSPSESCDGVCQPVGAIDGRTLGFCQTSCRDGDRECLAGPLFRACESGQWSSQAQACPSATTCQPLSSGARLAIRCGNACDPGTSRCSADRSGVESCNTEGLWAASVACALGQCVQSGAQAQCQTECMPGEFACAFDGDSVSRRCGETGLWLPAAPCADGAVCRIGSHALGCLQCVGSQVPGGNAWGVADSSCVGGGVAVCGADNELGASQACPGGQACVEAQRARATLAYCQ